MIQKNSFISEEDEKLRNLNSFRDEQGVIRIKTKIIYRNDEDLLKPVVLPSQHEVIKMTKD